MENGLRCLISFYDGYERKKTIEITQKSILPSLIGGVTFVGDNQLIVDIHQENVKRYKIRDILNETLVKKNLEKKTSFLLTERQCKLIISLKNSEVTIGDEIIIADTILVWLAKPVIVDAYIKDHL